MGLSMAVGSSPLPIFSSKVPKQDFVTTFKHFIRGMSLVVVFLLFFLAFIDVRLCPYFNLFLTLRIKSKLWLYSSISSSSDSSELSPHKMSAFDELEGFLKK